MSAYDTYPKGAEQIGDLAISAGARLDYAVQIATGLATQYHLLNAKPAPAFIAEVAFSIVDALLVEANK